MAQDQIRELSPDLLLLDLENPRFGLIDAHDQDERRYGYNRSANWPSGIGAGRWTGDADRR